MSHSSPGPVPGAPQSGVPVEPDPDDAGSTTAGRHSDARRRFLVMLAWDVALPLAIFYGLRLLGADQWWALVLGGVVPVGRLAHTAMRERRLEAAGLFMLTMLLLGTAVGVVTADPRLLIARESYLTAAVGAWILLTLLMRRPLLFTATVPFLPPQTAADWEDDWCTDPSFRRALRIMTAGWGLAFLIDAAARIIMAYTLPLDLVPVLGIVLLVGMLAAVMQGTKMWARRQGERDKS